MMPSATRGWNRSRCGVGGPWWWVWTFFLAALLPAWAADPTGEVVDVVTDKVVELRLTATPVPGQEFEAVRDGQRVARLRVRTELGVCDVLEGEVRKGDQVRAVAAAKPVAPGKPEPGPAATTPAAPEPEGPLRQLLLAQGKLELGLFLAGTPPTAGIAPPAVLTEAAAVRDRLLPAGRLLTLDTLPVRVAEALRDDGLYDLAARLGLTTPVTPTLAPLLPPAYQSLAPRRDDWPLLDHDPRRWSTPGFWGEDPQPPVFTDWTFGPDDVQLGEDSGPLLRNDLKLDDALLTGDLRIDSGKFLMLVLRSDVVVKVHSGGGGTIIGNINVKFGYNNLMASDRSATVPDILTGKWYPFAIRLERDQLRLEFDGKEALTTTVAVPADAGVRLAGAGYFGVGAYSAKGAFRNLRLRPLSPQGRALLWSFRRPPGYVAAGPPLNVLAEPRERLIALSHHQVEPYKADAHPIANGVLTVRGAAYSQFSHQGLAGPDWRVSGKLRVLEMGSVWLRANRYLLFGLKAVDRARTGKDALPKNPFMVKHSTGNFHRADESFNGVVPDLNQWYTFELEYHHPAGTLRLNGVPVMISVTPATAPGKDFGPLQFGISTYGAVAEVRDLLWQKLAPEAGPAPPPGEVEQLLRAGLAEVKVAANVLRVSDRPGARLAAAVLAGERPPQLVTPAEFSEFAEQFRAAGEWPLYLGLLKANVERFGAKDPQRAAAEQALRLAQQKFDLAQEKVQPGELGLDNTIMTGDQPGTLAVAGDGRSLWLTVPTTGELLLYSPAPEHRIARRLKPATLPVALAARRDYLLGLDEGRGRLHKLDPETGRVLATLALPKGLAGDLALVPGRPLTYLCVNENPGPEQQDLDQHRIYAVDETRMTATLMDARGMFLAVDPAGRYLYAGFHLRLNQNSRFNPGSLPVQFFRGHIDHVICYQIGETGVLGYVEDRANPGVDGRQLVPDPWGQGLAYVAAGGVWSDPDPKRNGFRIPELVVGNLQRLVKAYETSRGSSLLAYNPRRLETYIYTGDRLGRFNAETGARLATIDLPERIEKGTATELVVAPNGQELIIAFGGAKSGFYLHRLSPVLEPTEQTLVELLALAPEAAIARLRQQAVSGDAKAGRLLLERLARYGIFTPVGELAAAELLKLEQISLEPPGDLFTPPPQELAELPAAVNPATVQAPAMSTEALAGVTVRTDAKYGDREAFRRRLEQLSSLALLAGTQPATWRWLAWQAQHEFPDSTALELLIARTMYQAGRDRAAAAHAANLLKLSAGKGWYATAAWSLLADVYARQQQRDRQLSALSLACDVFPRNALLHSRFGEVLAAAGRPLRADVHFLQSLLLFPSQPTLRGQLEARKLLPPTPATEPLSIAELFRRVSPSVVVVKQDLGSGTGFFITRDGQVITNWHVIRESKTLTVVYQPGESAAEQQLPASLLAVDQRRDLALLAVNPGQLAIVPLLIGAAPPPATGERVVAIGNPGMGGNVLTHTITEGIISNLNRQFLGQAYLQTSAAVNPGNSGGPLLNLKGQVIGVVTLKANLENVGFAIPAADLLQFIERTAR